MAYDVLPGLGAPLRRVEDARLLIGGGRYTADVAAPGALHVVFLRSPHAHAEVVAVDATAARAMPGAAAVITAAETAALGHNPAVSEIFGVSGARHIEPSRPPIARGKVRHVGEIVAMVVADTLAQARDAAEAVVVDYAPLPAVVTGDAALAPGAPLIHAEAPGNLLCDWQRGDAEAVAAGFARAAHVSRLAYRGNRVVAGYLETRAALARWEGDALTLVTPSQGVHLVQRVVCAILGIPREALRVVSEDVGGGFGPKLPPYPEQALVAFAARALHRDIRWEQSRTEHHLCDTHARDLVAEASLALDAEGRFLAIKVEGTANFGAFVSTVAPTIPTMGMAKVLSGLYAFPAASIALRCAFSNTVPVDAIRGAGKPEAFILLETLIDQAARETGRDPIALRRLNLIPAEAFPYRTALGFRYDSGDCAALLDAALAEADADGFAARRAASEARGMLRGFGLACHLHGTGGWGDETSILRIGADGVIEAVTGTQSQGQGHATAYAQIVAAALGVAPESVRVVQGDTARAPRGGGTGGSSSTIISGATLKRAADAAIAAGMEAAAEKLEVAAADLAYRDARYVVEGTDRDIGLFELAAAIGGIDGCAEFDTTVESWPAGVAIAEVEIDPETGAVRLDRFSAAIDAGVVVNPMLLAGQLHGGFCAGAGQALMEDARYDAEGQPLAATLMDYAMPRADDVPDFAHALANVPTPNNPLGIKGVGELPTNGAPAAIGNAVADALGGIAVAMPMTPARVWQALQNAASLPTP
ncbi:xanthine dehydrogenase family protein molybdopterin-binding subunit [Plastoroseomonas arctica]|uniref:Xanthine dehydrogenase family protein molybdopterin-binding subunit n=1 Tax=Plastoroseomonas arctica TaxID=1509237 RepID=A0AAF1KUC1_9PROT|nr:xanthine dehydrogenase family protein molybdopterin-binding subunit [Plastoroseomonas arctica]MBR0655917.1 xanthine dehydrogenase family protein molybdopterin-binding subunit [Plastoroseomonas arctica]